MINTIILKVVAPCNLNCSYCYNTIWGMIVGRKNQKKYLN